jgi:hypothetical protein
MSAAGIQPGMYPGGQMPGAPATKTAATKPGVDAGGQMPGSQATGIGRVNAPSLGGMNQKSKVQQKMLIDILVCLLRLRLKRL